MLLTPVDCIQLIHPAILALLAQVANITPIKTALVKSPLIFIGTSSPHRCPALAAAFFPW